MVFLYNRTPYSSLNKLEDVYQHMSSENLRSIECIHLIQMENMQINTYVLFTDTCIV